MLLKTLPMKKGDETIRNLGIQLSFVGRLQWKKKTSCWYLPVHLISDLSRQHITVDVLYRQGKDTVTVETRRNKWEYQHLPQFYKEKDFFLEFE